MVKEDLADILSEFARTMVTNFPIERIISHLVDRIAVVMPVTGAGVTLISNTLHPEYLAASSPAALRFEQLQSEIGEGPCLTAYRTGEAVSVQDLNNDPRFPVFAPRALSAGLKAVFTFPLCHGDGVLGALDLYRETAGPLSPESMSAAQTLADVAAAYLINARARSDLQESFERFHEAALHDGLTGLPNRRLLTQRLEHAFLRVERSRKTIAVFFVDIDAFKVVNDTYGHQVGDELLVAVAARLAEVLRPGDSLARLAGDEFVVLCEDLDEPAQADAIAVRVDAALSRPFMLGDVELTIRGSIGLACNIGSDDAPEALIHSADVAMYRSKRRHGSRRQVRSMREVNSADRPSGLAARLGGALGRAELELAYQPIVDTRTGRVTAFEALLRWTHPNRGRLSPAVFLPFAEQSEGIGEIVQWVLERACEDRHRWQRAGAGEIGLSVNISAQEFMAAGFARSVTLALDGSSTPPGLLTLEVTESILVRDRHRAMVVVDELKAGGIKLAFDDFGTGYSALNHLQALPVDAIKIGRSFVANICSRPADRTIVNAIIQLAHGLGMTVVSEGVEKRDQHRVLILLGSDSCQGSYFAAPMAVASVDRLVHGRGGDLHLPVVNSSRRAAN